jgi:predicted lipid-binding transport protein (Tim44 family)
MNPACAALPAGYPPPMTAPRSRPGWPGGHVARRATRERPALSGAVDGAWFGLLGGLLLGLVTVSTDWLVVLVAALVIGACLGAWQATHGSPRT